MSFLRNLLGTSQVYPEPNEVLRPEDVQAQIDERETRKKGFFERVSEGFSSVVNSIRGKFRKKAMRVVEMTDLEKLAIEESMDGGVVVTVDRDAGVVRSTRWMDDRGSLSDADRKHLANSRGRVYGTTERKPRGRRVAVSNSIWSELAKRQIIDTPDPDYARKKTGTDSSLGFQVEKSTVQTVFRTGLSGLQSKISLKYGVSIPALETAYYDYGRTKEQLLFTLSNRIKTVSKDDASNIALAYADLMFVNGRLVVSEVENYINELLSSGVAQRDLQSILRDTASLAYVLKPYVKTEKDDLPTETSSESHTGLFDGVSEAEVEKGNFEFDEFSGLHLGDFEENEKRDALDAFEAAHPSEVMVGEIDTRSDEEIFGESDLEEVEPEYISVDPVLEESSISGESKVEEKQSNPVGIRVEDISGVDAGLNHSDAKIVSLEEYSNDSVEADSDAYGLNELSSDADELRKTMDGGEDYQIQMLEAEHKAEIEAVRAAANEEVGELRREIEDLKAEIEDLKGTVEEGFANVNETLSDQGDAIGKLTLDLERTSGIVDGMMNKAMLSVLNNPEGTDLSMPKLPSMEEYSNLSNSLESFRASLQGHSTLDFNQLNEEFVPTADDSREFIPQDTDPQISLSALPSTEGLAKDDSSVVYSSLPDDSPLHTVFHEVGLEEETDIRFGIKSTDKPSSNPFDRTNTSVGMKAIDSKEKN